MKEEFSRKIDILVQMCLSCQRKGLKEKTRRISSIEAEHEEDILRDLIENALHNRWLSPAFIQLLRVQRGRRRMSGRAHVHYPIL